MAISKLFPTLFKDDDEENAYIPVPQAIKFFPTGDTVDSNQKPLPQEQPSVRASPSSHVIRAKPRYLIDQDAKEQQHLDRELLETIISETTEGQLCIELITPRQKSSRKTLTACKNFKAVKYICSDNDIACWCVMWDNGRATDKIWLRDEEMTPEALYRKLRRKGVVMKLTRRRQLDAQDMFFEWLLKKSVVHEILQRHGWNLTCEGEYVFAPRDAFTMKEVTENARK